jgi:hypothetical protein
MSSKITTGTRAQVWHGTARHTSGGLTKSDLMKNKAGRIVSRKKHHSAKKDNRLVKAGYKTKKGTFGFVKVGSRKRGRKGHRGGSGNLPLAQQLWGNGSAETRALQAGGAPYGDNVTPSNFSAGDSNGSSMLGNGISGAGITNFGLGSTGVQIRAGMTGGYPGPPPRPPMGGRRRKGRKGQMGGLYNRSHGPQGVGSAGVQLQAGMYGGTTSQRFQLSPGSVTDRALGAAE